MYRLAPKTSVPARVLYTRLMGAWGTRPDKQWLTVKVSAKELRLLRSLGLPKHLLDLDKQMVGWVAVYEHPKKRHIKVRVYSPHKRPPKKRTFNVRGGKARLVAVTVVNLKKEAARVAAKTKTRSKKSKKDEELEELEELEGLDDLDDEDLDDEEPDEDEDEEDEDEDDEDEDDDEEDEPPAKKSKSKKSSKAKASKGKKSRRKPVEEDDEDEDDEDDEEEKPKRKAKGKSSKKSKKGSSKGSPREALADGKLSPEGVAKLSKGEVDARQVRVFLRENTDKFPKKEGQFRYAFTEGGAKKVLKAMGVKVK